MDAFLERALGIVEGEAGSGAEQGRRVAIVAADGFELAGTVFEPATGVDPARVVVVSSATGVRRRYYAPFAAFLAARGHTVVTFDYRGVGGSRPPRLRGFRARMRDWGELDLRAALDFALGELGATRPVVVGHSVGGQIAALAPNAARVSALLFVGAQVGDPRLWPAADRLRLFAFWYGVVPTLTRTLGYLPGAIFGGEDLPAGVAAEWARWGRRPGYIVGGADHGRRAQFASLRVPLRAYAFADDPLAPLAAARALAALYAGARVDLRHVAPEDVGARAIGHFGFFRRAFRASLWVDAADWIDRAPRLRFDVS